MKAVLLLLLAIPLAGCRTQFGHQEHLAYAGGDGSSCQQAVVINGADYREAWIIGQRLWLQQKYPGYRQTTNQTVTVSSRRFEQVELTSSDGQTASVYFDANSWWAK